MFYEDQGFETNPDEGSQGLAPIYDPSQSPAFPQFTNPLHFSRPLLPPSLPSHYPIHVNSLATEPLSYYGQTGQPHATATATQVSQSSQSNQDPPRQDVVRAKGTQAKRKAPRKGKGSKSGANSRDAGGSDVEIAALDEKTRAQADITVPPKRAEWDLESTVKLVEFITSPEQWGNVTTSLSKICQEASQNLFQGKYSTEQCVNKWQSEFRKYKAAKRILNHTGGGDGDEDTVESDSDSDKDNIKKEEQAHTGSNLRKFSSHKLRNFSEGPIFAKIQKVAEGRADIDRVIEFSSHRKPEDIDKDVRKASRKRKKPDEDDFDSIFMDTVKAVKDQYAATAHREEEHFTYQRMKDEREEKHREEELRLERERFEREAAITASRENREKDNHRMKKLEFYQRMRDSEDPLEKAMARKLAEEIREEEGL